MKKTFPDNFIFGAGTSAYQIEGAWDADCKSESNWDSYVRTPGNIENEDTGDIACDHYNRYVEDVNLMRELGLDAYRFSTSWPRVVPGGTGKINPQGLAFYDRLTDALITAGIRPWVCLYHWDHPQILEEKGGWVNRDMAKWYVDYAMGVVNTLKDRVDHFILFNEPNMFTLWGYTFGKYPPGVKDLQTSLKVTHNFNLASGMARRAIREVAVDAQVGTVVQLSEFIPIETGDDVKTRIQQEVETKFWAFTDPLITGAYGSHTAERLDDYVLDGDMETISEGLDFLGINHYSRVFVRLDDEFGIDVCPPPSSEEMPRTAIDWEICPEGLGIVLCQVKERYGDIPLYVTENGAVFNDSNTEGRVEDPERVSFLRGYITECHKAIEEGVNLRGYFVWSLLDNFEWIAGYSQRFGIIYVDFESLTRIPKSSYFWYSQLCKSHEIS